MSWARSSFCVSSYDYIKDKVTKLLWINDFCFSGGFLWLFTLRSKSSFSSSLFWRKSHSRSICFIMPPSVHKDHWSHVAMCDWKTSNGSICYYTIRSIHKCWIGTCGSRDVVNIVNIHGLLLLFIVINFMSATISQRNALLC